MPRFRVSFVVAMDVEAGSDEEARAVVAQGIDDLSAAEALARTDEEEGECPEARDMADALDAIAADDGARLTVVRLPQAGAA